MPTRRCRSICRTSSSCMRATSSCEVREQRCDQKGPVPSCTALSAHALRRRWISCGSPALSGQSFGLVKIGFRTLGVSLCVERVATIHVRAGKVRFQPDGLTEVRYRLVEVPLGAIGGATVYVCERAF